MSSPPLVRPLPVRPPHPLVCSGLRKQYGATVALDGLDLVVREGTIHGLVGPNGSGKTTAIRCVTGLARPDAGSVRICGESGKDERSRRKLALVPDEPVGLDELVVAEFLELLRSLHRAPSAYGQRAAALLALTPLRDRRHAPLGSLSRGLRRLVAVVGALVLAPPLLVVDEATAALDPEAIVVLREGLRAAAARGGGVLLATQDLAFAEAVCDDVTLLRCGATAAAGPVGDVVAAHGATTLEGAFLAAIGGARLETAVHEALGAR
ncbi:MAG TPA: ABC transporter ATP-binding protein [Gaiellaceae bacterium]|nr:ABC transporter ATP-binding protein [Gaiellaceae bacterium]